MDAKTEKIVNALILDNIIPPPRGGMICVISARLTKTGAVVVFEDGRKLELFKLNPKQKALNEAIRKEKAATELKAEAKAKKEAAAKKKAAAHKRAMAKAKKGK